MRIQDSWISFCKSLFSFWYCSGPEQRRFGPVSEHFLFRSWNMLSIHFVLSETVATVSLSPPPSIVHIRR